MVNWMLKLLSQTMTKLLKHKRFTFELILGSLLALSVCYGTIVYNSNKKLSESLEQAQNNIEAYQDIVSNNDSVNSVLLMDLKNLQNSNDKLIQQIDSVRKQNKIKKTSITSAATQTQTIIVNKSKEVVGKDLITVLKDTTYVDSIQYNKYTTVYYTIGKDTVNIGLNLKNTQYLYTYKQKEYKNKKNFFKRLFTLDFKKVTRYKYKIVNTNDLLKTSDVRIIEQ